MMTLARASSFFDRTDATDAYTGALLFRCQIDPFDEAKRDSYAPYRRMMSVSPDVSIPAHRAVRALGQVWLVGEGEPDGLSQLHRRKFVVSPANALLKVSDLNDFVHGRHGEQVWASVYWARDVRQTESSSKPAQMYDVFTGGPVPELSVLWGDGAQYLCTSARPMASGLASSHSLVMTEGPKLASLLTRRFVPARGGYDEQAQEGIRCVRVRWQNLFEYDAETDRRYQEGDVTVLIPLQKDVELGGLVLGLGGAVGTQVAPTTSTRLDFDDGKFQILATNKVGDVWALHCRRV